MVNYMSKSKNSDLCDLVELKGLEEVCKEVAKIEEGKTWTVVFFDTVDKDFTYSGLIQTNADMTLGEVEEDRFYCEVVWSPLDFVDIRTMFRLGLFREVKSGMKLFGTEKRQYIYDHPEKFNK